MLEKKVLLEALDEIRARYRAQNMGKRLGWGKNPAIVVIDFQKVLADPSRHSGSNMDAEVLNTAKLLDKGREKGIPIIYTVTTYDEQCFDGGLWTIKMPSVGSWKNGSWEGELDDRLNYREGEKIFVKKYCSMFHATGMASFLTAKGIDTLIIAGCSTSGCVRASTTDAMCNGFRAILPRECINDREWIPHEVSLLDMDTRFADVMSLQEVMDHLDQI